MHRPQSDLHIDTFLCVCTKDPQPKHSGRVGCAHTRTRACTGHLPCGADPGPEHSPQRSRRALSQPAPKARSPPATWALPRPRGPAGLAGRFAVCPRPPEPAQWAALPRSSAVAGRTSLKPAAAPQVTGSLPMGRLALRRVGIVAYSQQREPLLGVCFLLPVSSVQARAGVLAADSRLLERSPRQRALGSPQPAVLLYEPCTAQGQRERATGRGCSAGRALRRLVRRWCPSAWWSMTPHPSPPHSSVGGRRPPPPSPPDMAEPHAGPPRHTCTSAGAELEDAPPRGSRSRTWALLGLPGTPVLRNRESPGAAPAPRPSQHHLQAPQPMPREEPGSLCTPGSEASRMTPFPVGLSWRPQTP